jgi:hypothetical protein
MLQAGQAAAAEDSEGSYKHYVEEISLLHVQAVPNAGSRLEDGCSYLDTTFLKEPCIMPSVGSSQQPRKLIDLQLVACNDELDALHQERICELCAADFLCMYTTLCHSNML